MAHELPPLPYDYAALEPYIDQQTMHLHHDMHHGTYVKNLTAVRNNGGGHVNHTMFWKIMKPKGGGEPSGKIADVIKKTFGSFKDFQTRFNDAGAKQFGSGWVWLAAKPSGEVQIITTPNQDNPISQGVFPIMGNDVWEHAYYLKYNNRRPEYLQAWWNVVNWEEINKRLEAVKTVREPALAHR